MIGLDVTPVSPSSRRRASSPDVMSWRRMLSSQSDWPRFLSSLTGAGTRVFVAMALLPGKQLGRGRHDVPRRDAGGVHQLFGLARGRQALDREMRQVQPVLRRKGLEHRGAEATLRVVVLDDD